MKTIRLVTTAALILLTQAGCGGNVDVETAPVLRAEAATVIATWPATSREVAETIIGRYGPPDEATASRLMWFGNGPWKRTIVYRDTIEHRFPMPHVDLLEQVIDYRVPPDMFDELAHYDGSVIVERTRGEMAARCDKELANFLAINLAHDVVTGRRTVDEARRFYAETIEAVKAGERPAYTREFQFQVPRGGTADPDHPAPGM